MKKKEKKVPVSRIAPETALFRVAFMLKSGNSEAALSLLFRLAAREDIPKDWSAALKRLTKQLRRAIGHLEAAEGLAEKNRSEDADARLKQAEKIMAAQGEKALRVEYGSAGVLDYWRHVMDGAKEMLYTTTQRVLGTLPAKAKKRR